MPTILPPPPTPQPLPTASPATTVVTLPNPPAAIMQLPPGTLMRAEIIQLVARGTIEVQTEYGSVQLRTSLALAAGAKLELQLLRTLPQVQLAIRTVDGSPQGPYGRAPSPPQTSSGPDTASAIRQQATGSPTPTGSGAALTSATVAPPPNLSIGSLLRATVLRPALDASAASRMAGSPLPAASAAPSPTTASSSAANSGTLAPATSLPSGAGAHIDVRIAGITPFPNAAAGAAGSSASPGIIAGTVAALVANGRPIVETPIGLISLETTSDIRVGTQIQFAIVSSGPRVGTALIGASAPELFVQGRAWPVLEEAIAYFAQRPQGAPQTLPPALPQANAQLGSSILFFLTALKGGNINAWLGSAASILESERPELARQLNEEFAQFARTLNDAPAHDWRTAVVPFFNGAQLEPIQMHIRGGKSQRGDAGEEEGSRFIIDVDLSRLGRIQLDGFVKTRRSENKQAFDLIVRTENPLPHRMRRDINHIFVDFSEAAGLTGAISFQARAQFVEVPLPRLRPGSQDGLIV